MPELTATFANLNGVYAAIWTRTSHSGSDRKALMRTFARPHWHGVYVIHRKEQDEPLYIGSAGKLERGLRGMGYSGQTVRQRLFYSNTPYFFDGVANVWRYGPTTQTVPPAGYCYQVPIPDIRIETFHVPDTHAPSSLEHLLLQGCVNQFGNLPVANQKF